VQALNLAYWFIPYVTRPDGATLIVMASVIVDDDPGFRLVAGQLLTEGARPAPGEGVPLGAESVNGEQPAIRNSQGGDRRV
jgi:hypothetical protein